MICVYSADCTDFSNNGLGVLCPQSAEVSETMNGSYELMLVHPQDDAGKWRRLAEGRIIRAPVPAALTPILTMETSASPAGEVWRVSTHRDPLRLRSGTGTKYKILAKYKKGTEVIVLDKSNSSWYEVSCPDGKRGYMSKSYLTYVRTMPSVAQEAQTVMEARQLRDQPFRIYRIVPELDKFTVYARHIFYDLLENMVQSYKPSANQAGASVVQGLSAACLSEHPFCFYSDLESKAEEVAFENKNPVDCLLGDEGLIAKYGGELVRDWYDVFIVKRAGADTNIQIREGKNLTGIKYDLDLTDVVTRIMPTGQDADGNLLYLPELYLDSPNIGLYPFPKWYHLDVSEAKEVKSGKDKKTKAQCYAAMREAAQAEFDNDCDLPDVTLNVDFVNVTDTEEYRPYGFLQNIFLGDAVRVITKRVGVSVSMRMTEYTYDCLKRKYTKMSLGTVADTVAANTITSRQLPSGIITGSKLALHSVGTGQLQDGSVGSLQIQNAAVGNAHIQTAAVEAANIKEAAIEFAHIAQATVQALHAGAIEATAAKIDTLKASDIETDTLAAALAAFTVLTCGTATFDAATVKHLVSESMNLEYGAAGQVFIRNLAVEYAQMVGAAIGNLCIKASDGNYYSIDVDESGNVTGTQTSVSSEEIAAGQTEAGQVILEMSITASDINTGNLLATFALVNHIDAARLDVDALFARRAFIDALNTSMIQSQDFIELVVGQVDETVEEVMRDATPAVLRIDSSRGTVFKDNNISTVLSVSIHYGALVIESASAMHAAFGSGAYLQWEWLRMDEDRYGILSASDSRLSDGGFHLTLGPQDVDTKVTFRCKLITE